MKCQNHGSHLSLKLHKALKMSQQSSEIFLPKKQGQQQTLRFKPNHNIYASLSPIGDAKFDLIFHFLNQSNYAFAITTNPTIYEDHI